MISHKLTTSVSKHPRTQAARQICELLNSKGWQAYWVGGCVRDFLLNPDQVPHDIDITTNASFNDICQILPNTRAIGKAFGVGLCQVNEFAFEVATFRKESDYADRRHPSKVGPGSIEEDSTRRDFTINAFYYDPLNEALLDFHDGMKDLSARQLRCVGNAAARLHEDPLRILRLFRFAANLQLTIEGETLSAATQLTSELTHISLERVLLEIGKVKAQGITEFAKNFLSAEKILLEHSFKNASKKAERTPQNKSREQTISELSSHPVFMRTELRLPQEAFQFPGSILALICIFNEGVTARHWPSVFNSWPIAAEERTHIEFLQRLGEGQFNLASAQPLSESEVLGFWKNKFETIRWAQRQNKLSLGEIRWMCDNFNCANPQSDLIFALNTKTAHLSANKTLAETIELLISAEAKALRQTIHSWAQNKSPAALGWARLMSDSLLLLAVLNLKLNATPPFFNLASAGAFNSLCDLSLHWSEKKQSKRK